MDVPSRCTACGTAMATGETRCRQCGKVYGADNLCARCQNTTGVRAVAGGYRCLACGARRERNPRTIVAEGDVAGGALLRRGAPGLLRALGAGALAGSVLLGAALFALVGGAAGGVLAGAIVATGGGLGLLAMRSGARMGASAAEAARASRERALADLAAAKGGSLTVTDVALGLGVSVREAESALDAIADGSRVSAEVTSDGRIEYVFRELVATRGPKVRVELEVGEPAEHEAASAAESRREEEC